VATAIGRPRAISLVALAGGLLVTAVLTIAAARANAHSNRRLLDLQVRQAAATLTATVPSIETQLADALQVALATNSPSAFLRFSGAKVGRTSGFTSISLWKKAPAGWLEVALDGARPQLVADGLSTSFFSSLHHGATIQLTGILPGNPRRIGIAEFPPRDPRYIVYAENELPSKTRVVVPKSSAFNDLNFAIYIGPVRPANLVESSLPTPVRGPQAEATAPFGNTVITLVAEATTSLAGGSSADLPWIAFGVGLALSLGGASTLEYVQRRREHAERLAAEIQRLLEEQRKIASTLQGALLPELPRAKGLDLAARYLPGAEGIDVGGDWYDVVPTQDGRYCFVVGDVSGRGLDAATTMASLRFATRAYIAEGDPPEVVLEKLNELIHFEDQGQFATVLIGDLDIEGHRVTVASAGHLAPLVVSGSSARFADAPIAAPIGVAEEENALSTTFEVPPGGTLIAFTDGLVERRGEHLDVSLERLRTATHSAPSSQAILDEIIETLVPDGSEDDVVILGVRWTS
jgi:serine phosphatase RsbU (regulator of sigma subunit)